MKNILLWSFLLCSFNNISTQIISIKMPHFHECFNTHPEIEESIFKELIDTLRKDDSNEFEIALREIGPICSCSKELLLHFVSDRVSTIDSDIMCFLPLISCITSDRSRLDTIFDTNDMFFKSSCASMLYAVSVSTFGRKLFTNSSRTMKLFINSSGVATGLYSLFGFYSAYQEKQYQKARRQERLEKSEEKYMNKLKELDIIYHIIESYPVKACSRLPQ